MHQLTLTSSGTGIEKHNKTNRKPRLEIRAWKNARCGRTEYMDNQIVSRLQWKLDKVRHYFKHNRWHLVLNYTFPFLWECISHVPLMPHDLTQPKKCGIVYILVEALSAMLCVITALCPSVRTLNKSLQSDSQNETMRICSQHVERVSNTWVLLSITEIQDLS